MTKTTCEYCGFEGHSYQQAAHFRKEHVLLLPVEIESIRFNYNKTLAYLGVRVGGTWIEIEKPANELKRIAKIESHGEKWLKEPNIATLWRDRT